MELWFLIVLLVGGLIAGGLARLAVPGPDPMAWWATALLGIAGWFVGGLVSWSVLGEGPGIVFAFLGAVALLIGYRKLVQKRPLTGPRARQLP